MLNNESQNKILVIATAAIEGGALTILAQFLDSIPKEDRKKYILFVSPLVCENKIFSDFLIHCIDTANWPARIYHDLTGYSREVKKFKHSINLCINFQNIPARIGHIKQIVYMHQSLPFYNVRWNIFKKSERKFWLYRKIYILFIAINKKYAWKFIAQSNWLAQSLAKKINYDRNNIVVLKPGISPVFKKKRNEHLLINNNFVYPAAFHDYKNHEIIFQALSLLGVKYLEGFNFKLILTINSSKDIVATINSYGLGSVIELSGVIDTEELNRIYDESYSLLFPSKIESFGLPLVEAASKGLYIICADLPYARENLISYRKAFFANPDKSNEWALLIRSILEGNKDVQDGSFEYESDWPKLQTLIKNTLK